jgi:PhnB protein
MSKLPRPDGHHVITPAFVVESAAKVIAFLERAFGATVVERYDGPGDSVAHAEIRLGDSVVMCGDANPDFPAMPASFSYYVDDAAAVDATYQRALDAGATSERPPADQFYGYRSATVRDVGGNRWTICTVIELVPSDEAKRRMAEMMKSAS